MPTKSGPRAPRARFAAALVASTAVVLAACAQGAASEPTESPLQGPSLPSSGPVPASGETKPFATGSGDLADDPAIWVDAADGGRSVVIGTKKASTDGGLAVYDLAGNELQFLPAGKLNNVDIRQDVLGGRVLIVASNRTENSLSYFSLDPSTRQLSPAGATPLGFEPYGTCLYVSPADGEVYAFVTEDADRDGRLEQYRLTSSGADVTGAAVRTMTTSSLSEGCVADDSRQAMFLAEEDLGVYRYPAEPTDDDSRSAVALVSDGDLVADVEGVDIAYDPSGEGAYLVVSAQGNSTYHVYDALEPYAHRKQFSVAASGSVDEVTSTDGLAVTRADLGPLYPHGLLVVHDSSNPDASSSNFKFVDAGAVFGATATAP